MQTSNHHAFPPKPDWQVVLIASTFVDEVDCNSGKHRRVFESGKNEYLD